jgi:CheY-like chemotaxis protein
MEKDKRGVNMGKKHKILIVDDNADTITTLTDLLNEHGYNVTAACDGQEALEIAEKEKPDLALVDIRLPKLDGYEVCRRIKQNKAVNTKVILFTAYGDAVNVAMAKKAGADDFKGKTTEFTNILQAIEHLI